MPSTPTADDLEREEHELLARYRANVAAAEQALEAVTKEPVVAGSTKQPVPNGLFAIAAVADERAVAYHRELESLRKRRAEIAEIEAGRVADARLR